jgi:carbon monoxide dehydrogenase subunit G
MEETATKLPADVVWRAWEIAHAKKGVRYKIMDVAPGRQLTVMWRAWGSKLLITYRVIPTDTGSNVGWSCQIKGPFAWIVRFFAQRKIELALRRAMADFVQNMRA